MAHSTADPSNPVCNLCEEDETQNVAITWCIDCETFLCSNCNTFHGRSRASKEHNTISVESYNALPTFITNIQNHCQEHGKRFEAYCSVHGVTCCLDCIISNHSGCKEIRKVTDVVKGFKSSSSVFHIETDLSDLAKNFELIEGFLTKRLASIDSQKNNVETEIKTMKQNIIDHLDSLERKLLNHLESTHSEMKSNIEGLNKTIKSKKAKIGHLQNDLRKMKEYATELQMFEGIKEIGNVVTEQMKYIEECQTKGSLDENKLEVKFSPDIKSITTELESFGNVSVSISKCPLELNLCHGQQVRTDQPIIPNINDIKPKLTKTITVSNSRTSGCQILPDARMLFLDESKQRMMLFSQEGDYIRDVVTFTKKPFEVVNIKDNVVAVSTHCDKLVYFVDIESNNIIKTITLSTPCFGIDKDDSTIRLTTGIANSLMCLNLDGEFKNKQSIGPRAISIATFEDNIYFSDHWDDSVSCYSKSGDFQWTFQLDKGNNPRGLSVDRHGLVYVVCYSKHNITVISADGKRSTIILNQTDGLHYPVALSINKETATLLVANNLSGKAFLLHL